MQSDTLERKTVAMNLTAHQQLLDQFGRQIVVWVEVEFGNARSSCQHYVKFMMARKYRSARLGLLIWPTTAFASLLCELGRQRARDNVVRERPLGYSGMMSYEKAARELPYLGYMFEMPMVVAGVGLEGIR